MWGINLLGECQFKLLILSCIGMRRDRGSYNRGGSLQRKVARSPARAVASSQRQPERKATPPTSVKEIFTATLSPEELIGRIMEAEPPEIYLMKDMKKPFTEANVMMSLTNLADKELVHMISWAKKIPGAFLCVNAFIENERHLHRCITKKHKFFFTSLVFLFFLYDRHAAVDTYAHMIIQSGP